MDLEGLTAELRDSRARPRIPASAVGRGVLVMQLSRLGSFHALEQTRPSRFWRGFLGGALPSADTMGRVCERMDVSGIRRIQHQLYARLKRGKALRPPAHGLMAAVLDAHETHATRRRCCSGCLVRSIHTARGEEKEYYHRIVCLVLACQDQCFAMDVEPMQAGEDEVRAGMRLVDRAVAEYPRAFDVVAGDGLYARSDFFNHVKELGKEAIAVLKDEQRDLLQDARSLWASVPPAVEEAGALRREMWDISGFKTWPQCRHAVRVIRSRERRRVRRQLDDKVREETSDWVWVTTLTESQAGTAAAVQIGHSRWNIENQGFNELVNRWHADHIYRHHPAAILVLWLMAFLALNLFEAFYLRNLKPALRQAYDTMHISRLILTELLVSLVEDLPPNPSGP